MESGLCGVLKSKEDERVLLTDTAERESPLPSPARTSSLRPWARVWGGFPVGSLRSASCLSRLPFLPKDAASLVPPENTALAPISPPSDLDNEAAECFVLS